MHFATRSVGASPPSEPALEARHTSSSTPPTNVKIVSQRPEGRWCLARLGPDQSQQQGRKKLRLEAAPTRGALGMYHIVGCGPGLSRRVVSRRIGGRNTSRPLHLYITIITQCVCACLFAANAHLQPRNEMLQITPIPITPAGPKVVCDCKSGFRDHP